MKNKLPMAVLGLLLSTTPMSAESSEFSDKPEDNPNLIELNEGENQFNSLSKHTSQRVLDTVPAKSTLQESDKNFINKIPEHMLVHNLYYANVDQELLKTLTTGGEHKGPSGQVINELANILDYNKIIADFKIAKTEFEKVDSRLKNIVSILSDYDKEEYDSNKLNFCRKILDPANKKFGAVRKANPELRTYEKKYNELAKLKSYISWIESVKELVKYFQSKNMLKGPNSDLSIGLNQEESVNLTDDEVLQLRRKLVLMLKKWKADQKLWPKRPFEGKRFVESSFKEADKLKTLQEIDTLSQELSIANPSLNMLPTAKKIRQKIEYLKKHHNLTGIAGFFGIEANLDEHLKNFRVYNRKYDESNEINDFSEYLKALNEQGARFILIKVLHVEHMGNKDRVEKSIKRLKQLFNKDLTLGKLITFNWKRVKKSIENLDKDDINSKEFQQELRELKQIKEYRLAAEYDSDSQAINVFDGKYLSETDLAYAKAILDREKQIFSVEALAKTMDRLPIFDKKMSKALRKGVKVSQEQKERFFGILAQTLSLYGPSDQKLFEEDIKKGGLERDFRFMNAALAKTQILLREDSEDEKELWELGSNEASTDYNNIEKQLLKIFTQGEDPGETILNWDNNNFYAKREAEEKKQAQAENAKTE